jgi:APA family basic amino acid/polyamine antiporter
MHLRRNVSLFAATVYGVGIILGAGVYALIGEATGLAGNSVWLSFVIAAIVSSFTGLSYMELISMFPQSAAEYIYAKKAFRNRLVAFNIGWVEIFADIIATSAVSLGFAGYFSTLVGIPIIPIALGLILVMSGVNLLGIQESSRVNIIFSLIEIIGLLFIVLLAGYTGKYFSVNYLDMPYGLSGTLSASALIFFAYIGFEDLANISEEVKNPKKNVPRALMYSVIITTVIYILVGLAVVSVVNWQNLAGSPAPLALVVSSVLGEQASWLMSIIALFATANTVLVGLIVGSREIYGMSRDGSLPKVFSKIHPTRGTPWIAGILTMLCTMAFVVLGQIKLVASVTDFGTFYIFIFVNAAAIALRCRMPEVQRAFRMPFNIGRFPLLSFLGIISSFLLASHLSVIAIVIGIGVASGGVLIHILIEKSPSIKKWLQNLKKFLP